MTKVSPRNQRTRDEMALAEARGEILSMPDEIPTALQDDEGDTVPVSDSPEEFRMAIGQAQMNGDEFVEVSEKLFRYLLKNSKSRYLTYGQPGVKVYLTGTRAEIEREERMNAEDHHNMTTKRRAELNNAK